MANRHPFPTITTIYRKSGSTSMLELSLFILFVLVILWDLRMTLAFFRPPTRRRRR